jgi:predicted transcriptional regulator
MATTARLGELEKSVMEYLWSTDDHWSTVRDVFSSLAAQREIAYTTVMTVLQRLARKGLVEEQKSGRAYRYQPAASRSDLTAELMRDALDQAPGSERRSALVRFVDSASDDELAALREALERLEST